MLPSINSKDEQIVKIISRNYVDYFNLITFHRQSSGGYGMQTRPCVDYQKYHSSFQLLREGPIGLCKNQHDQDKDQTSELKAGVKIVPNKTSENRKNGGYIPIGNFRDS